MSSVSENNRPDGQMYWRSLEDLADTPEFREFMHREFPAGATEQLSAADRRHFLKVMGASMALAGLGMAGCRRWPDETIAPFAKRPAGRSPGVPVHYATSMERGGVAAGLLVTSYDGRPVKIEGNPEHPVNRGATDALTQASVLNMYDPDRSRSVLHNGEASSWDAFVAWSSSNLGRQNGGAGVAVLTEATSSPTVARLKAALRRSMPQMSWHEYEPICNDGMVGGSELAFGSAQRPQYAFDRARVIVSLDSDFLCGDAAAVRNARRFAQTRTADDAGHTMSRLYQFESGLSLTGANADERIALRSSDIALVAGMLAAHILNDASLGQFESADRASSVLTDDLKKMIAGADADLQRHSGESLVIAGDNQPAEVHYLAALLNHALGNVGTTVQYTALPEQTAQTASIRELASAIDAGRVNTVVILGGNPVYDAPADLGLAKSLAGATVVHLADYVDETSAIADWHINRAHYLEAWGDGLAYDGTVTIGQPLIQPLFDGKSPIEVLGLMAGMTESGLELVKATFGGSDADWRTALHDGFVDGSDATLGSPQASSSNLATAASALLASWSTGATGMEVNFVADASTYDGRFANNAWMQETPDPITKLTWDNAAQVAPSKASELGLTDGDLIKITVGSASVEMPIIRVPGHCHDAVTLPLGYGRAFEGQICSGAGFNVYPLRTSDAMHFAGATVAAASGSYPLATTQDHHTIDIDSTGGKGIMQRLPTLVREGSLGEYKSDPKFAKHRAHAPHRLSMWDESLPFQTGQATMRDGSQYAWGMTIDLTKCTGCNACVVACQAENNIPVVGKDQVMRGRELHWLRVDRYYKFGKDADGHVDPDRMTGVALQPVPCMHCENAPCEQVCPVAATVHDADGLNVMVYNRCIGTRYCSNNCPYKVRRFNYFDYHRRKPHREQPGMLLQVDPSYYTKRQAAPNDLQQMQMNPEVSIRVRGVMEKCTFCVQRVMQAKIDAKNDFVDGDGSSKDNATRVAIADGTVQPACGQACASQAIVFGDLNDPGSAVTTQQKHDRCYEMLEELNVKPRTKYLAKLRNPNPDVSGAETPVDGGGHH